LLWGKVHRPIERPVYRFGKAPANGEPAKAGLQKAAASWRGHVGLRKRHGGFKKEILSKVPTAEKRPKAQRSEFKKGPGNAGDMR